MRCRIHKMDDGYQPTEIPGTMLASIEDLRHAWDVFAESLKDQAVRPVGWLTRLIERFTRR